MADVLKETYTGVAAGGFNYARSGYYLSESFTASETYSVTLCKIPLYRGGSELDPGNCTVEIRAVDELRKPTGAALATSDVVNLSALTLDTGGTETTFAFSTPYEVTSGTEYCLVIISAGGSGSLIWIGTSADKVTYAGISWRGGVPNWYENTGDVFFGTYGEGSGGAVTRSPMLMDRNMPNGWGF